MRPASLTLGTPAGFAMGAIGFMSPEQEADARSVGIHADIFSLGRTLYYLLSGQLPYRAGVESLLLESTGQEAVTPLETLRPELPGVEAAELVDEDDGTPTARSIPIVHRSAGGFDAFDES